MMSVSRSTTTGPPWTEIRLPQCIRFKGPRSSQAQAGTYLHVCSHSEFKFVLYRWMDTRIQNMHPHTSPNQKRPRPHDPIDDSSCLEPPAKVSKTSRGNEPPSSIDYPRALETSELVVLYESEGELRETLLLQRLRQIVSDGTLFDHDFRQANLVLRELGSCAADLFWREALNNGGSNDQDLSSQPFVESSRSQARDLVRHWPFKLPILDVSSRNLNVSYKFLQLVRTLETYQTYGEQFRGIIFVQKRVVARLLVALLRSLTAQLPFLRPLVLADHRLSWNLDVLETASRHLETGHYNLIIATKSFEDVMRIQVPIVILFDLFESQVSQAFTRSCTQDRQSYLIHMVQRGNIKHHHTLTRTTLNGEMRTWAQLVGHDSRSSAPPRTLWETSDPYLSDSEDEYEEDCLQEPVTGSQLPRHHATTVIYHFAALAGLLSDHQNLFTFQNSPEDVAKNQWWCRINLTGSPLDGVTGAPGTSKALARRNACYVACRRLQHAALLDSTIFPIHPRLKYGFGKNLHEDMFQFDPSREQPHISIPADFWMNSINYSNASGAVYPYLLSLTPSPSGFHEHQALCILTRSPLPELPVFQLGNLGAGLTVGFRRLLPSMFDEERMQLIHRFTVKFCRIIMNKPFESTSWQDMTCFFLPINKTCPSRVEQYTLNECIDWPLVSEVAERWATPIPPREHLKRFLGDTVIQDRAVEFTHRCEIIAVREDMTPLSEIGDKPLGYSLLKHTAFSSDEGFAQGGTTLLEQCHHRRKNFVGLKDPNQPILEVARMAGSTNCLNTRIPPQTEEPERAIHFLIPEYSWKLTIPASTLRTGYLLPSIMHRIEEYLLVKQLNARLLDNCIQEELLMMALASPLAGNEYDYERLELLGDAFLKYISSIYVFVQDPHGAEGDLHVARQSYISNQQLCRLASQLGIIGYIKLKPFNVKSWSPLGLTFPNAPQKGPTVAERSASADCSVTRLKNSMEIVSSNNEAIGKPKKKGKKRSKRDAKFTPISNKTVADVSEAIIGAAYISGGCNVALKACKALLIPFNNIEEWSDLSKTAAIPDLDLFGSQFEPTTVGSIEQIIHHKFKTPRLLGLALTHAPLNSQGMKVHQRLEFIGDAVLDFMVIRHLYNKYPESSPGELSLLKSNMVSNVALAAICVYAGLHKFVNMTLQLEQMISKYEVLLTQRQSDEHNQAGEEERRLGQYWNDLDAPKALSDVVESIIGALFISDGFSIVGAQTLFDYVLRPFYEKYLEK